jgi:hypothetical protein
MYGFKTRYTIILFCVFLIQALPFGYATYPTLMFHDPMPLYTPRGVDVLPPQLKSQDDLVARWFSWHVSAFTQQAKSSRNERGIKVLLGDRLGRINACGLFFNVHNKPLDDAGALATDPKQEYPTLVAAYNLLRNLPDPANPRYTDERYFQIDTNDDLNNKDGFMSVTSSFKKRGLRSTICIEPLPYFKFKINAGCSEYSYSGRFVSAQESADAPGIEKVLLNPQKMSDIAGEFPASADVTTPGSYELSMVKKSGFEDMFISAMGTYPVTFYGTDKEPSLVVSPFLGCGVWVPTGEKSDPGKFFSLSFGNEGFWGYGLNTGLSIHFLNMLYFSFEAALTFFNEKVVEMRYPTSDYQQGIFPFVGTFSKTPGMSWDINVSLCGRHVIEGLSFYIDWIYAQHDFDKIALPVNQNDAGELITTELKVPLTPITPARADEEAYRKHLTEQALGRLGELAFWKSEIFTIGFSYEVTPCLELGLAFRGNLSGRNITRTETILGTLKFAF